MKHFSFYLKTTFTFFLSLLYSCATSSTLPVKIITLLSIKASLKDPLNTLHDWDPTDLFSRPGVQPIWCTWSGVECDKKTREITTIDLSRKNLSGTISPDIKNLSRLQFLNLSRNFLDGPLEPAIYELQFLKTLDVSYNCFNSTFPSGISSLKSLTYLNAYSNSFNGSLPEEIVNVAFLEYLNLGGSYFDGVIPASYGGLPRLKYLHLAGNLLSGKIPPELGSLENIEQMEIGYNQYSSEIPTQFGRLSCLVYLDISTANVSGEIPGELGNLTKLETLLLFKNHLVGKIPRSISYLTSLKILDFSDNNLSGIIPGELSALKELVALSLMNNKLTGEIPDGFGDLLNLKNLSLWNNSLSGILPQNLGLNSKLQKLDVSSNLLSGPIPPELCHRKTLANLILFSNQFIGELPPSLAKCESLTRFRVQNNRLNGSIPFGFGSLRNFVFTDISKNRFTGPIPNDIVNAVKLEYINLSVNSFQAKLPDGIWSAETLQVFSASFAGLVGEVPDFLGCKSLYKIELEGNNLTGDIPESIDHCKRLTHLNLGKNSLTGIIPWEISTLPSITDVDLSRNCLTGTIPSNFDNCRTLESFNVSYNQLTGPVPSSGSIFSSFHPSSFIGNEGLCGIEVRKPCQTDDLTASAVDVHQQPKKAPGAIVWIISGALAVVIFFVLAGSHCLRANYRGKLSGENGFGPWKLTAFQRLNFTADDVLECLTMSKMIIGMGSAGTVYKAEMPDGQIIAVKKLWMKNKETMSVRRGVLAEVDVLGNVRHRNIVRLLGCCSNNECTMLLYEYMPNGSLDDLLHGNNKGENLVADWLTRYKIARDVAQGVCYLHHDCDPVIVHRDLKPSNILLDAEMEARVADFGVAKLIQNDESMSVIAGSYGYIAPEYTYTLQVDEKSDIYSYGVVLLEILTGKRSVDAQFGDGNSIVDWVRSKITNNDDVSVMLDKDVSATHASVRAEMMLLLRIALLCTSRHPADRPSMRDVVSMLQAAKPEGKLPGSS